MYQQGSEVAGTRSESERAVTPSKMAKSKIQNTCTSSYHKNIMNKILNQSDERRRRRCGDMIGRTDGWKDRMMDAHMHGIGGGSFLLSLSAYIEICLDGSRFYLDFGKEMLVS